MEKLVLKNAMEPLLEERLEKTLDSYDCCKCEICKMDMMAFALNHVPPRYVVSHMGGIFAKLGTLSVQYEIDLLNAVNQAIQTISVKPRHEIEQRIPKEEA